MGTIAVLFSKPDEQILNRLAAVQDLVYLAVPSHKWEWAAPLQERGLSPAPVDLDRQTMPFGYDETEFVYADAHAAAAMDAIITHLPPSYNQLAHSFTPPLRRWLKQLLGRRFRYALVLEKLATQFNGCSVLLLDKTASHGDLRDSLRLQNIQAEMYPPEETNAAAIAPSADWHHDFEKAFNKPSRFLKRGRKTRNSFAFYADLRNAKDFRHREMAFDLIKALLSHGDVNLLQPRTSMTRAVLRSLVEGQVRTWGRLSVSLLKPPSNTRQRSPGPWTSTLINAACANDAASDPLLPSKKRVLTTLLGRELPSWLAVAAHFDQQFKHAPPRAVVAVPGHSPLALLACQAATLNNIPAFDVHTLLQTPSARLAEPIADHLAVLDEVQQKLYADKFPDTNLTMRSFGPPQIKQWRRGVQKHQAKQQSSTDRPHLLFPTQPIWHESEQALAITLQALEALPSCDLTISLHPDESAIGISRYKQAIAASSCRDRVHLITKPIDPAMLAKADIVLTICSNVGYRAALLNIPTIAIVLDQPDTLRFDLMGLTTGARTTADLIRQIKDFAAHGDEYKTWQTSRQAYLDRHGWHADTDSTAAMAAWIAQVGKSAK